ncbi:hypothetical protein [Portibacter marinus]|uniref:hypothetical protein n=1 Tax=Portibacter marinus TaxID=2898660 RepID=UPI001F370BC4|nr:hypothetical protein [Portibacter marinus]
MNRIHIACVIVCLLFTNVVSSQLYIGNFVGEDSDEVNGTWNYEIPLGFPITLKKWNNGKHKLRIFPAYTFSQTFLSDRWIFDSDGTTTTYMLDPDPAHEYRKSIFTHQSKIRMWAWESWLGFESQIGKAEIHLFYTPSYIQVGSFRRKYVEDNEVIKVRDRFRDKADFYNIKRLQHRLKGSITLYGIGVGGYVNLTSFFQEQTGIDLQKFGLTIVIRQSFWTDLFDLALESEDKDNNNPEIKRMMF